MRNGLRAAALAFVLVATTAAATARLTPAQLQAVLASAPRLDAPRTGALFEQHFRDSCIAVDALPFERVCNYVAPEHADDPSPWPEVFLGVRDGRIVAVLQAAPGWAPPAWKCVPLPGFGGASLCTDPAVAQRTREAWSRRWSSVLRSAG